MMTTLVASVGFAADGVFQRRGLRGAAAAGERRDRRRDQQHAHDDVRVAGALSCLVLARAGPR